MSACPTCGATDCAHLVRILAEPQPKGGTMPNLQPNTMTVIELEGHALADMIYGLSNGPRKLSIMLEVEPNGVIYVKFKADEYRWSPPFDSTAGVAARCERLYDEPVAP